jgi:putative ABC transport system substrate-binding protein
MKINKCLIVICILTVLLLSGCVGKEERVYHVGILSGLDRSLIIADAFKERMTELGYVDGKTIVYDFQKTNFEPEKEKQILQKFVDDKVDLIFGFNTEVALEAKEATEGTGIPVVFAMGIIEGNELVDTVVQPGGNITGVRYPGPEYSVKRLEVFNELMPQAKRFWVPYHREYPAASHELEVLRPAAASLNLTLIEFPCENLAQIQAELEKRSQSADIGFDAVLYIPESLSVTREYFDIIANFTRERKIPIGGTILPPIDSTPTEMKDYGPVFGVTVYYPDEGKLAADLADKILRGTPAGTLPVVSPEPYVQVNYNVVQEIGLNVSEGFLAIADEIIR